MMVPRHVQEIHNCINAGIAYANVQSPEIGLNAREGSP